MSQFKIDLEAGAGVENKFVKLLQEKHPDWIIKTSEWYFPDRDVQLTKTDWTSLTFEVKYDRMVDKTGNIAIELSYDWCPSWICGSKADYIVYYAKEFFRYAKPSEVYSKITEYERIFGGDRKASELILIIRKDFINIFNRRWQ